MSHLQGPHHRCCWSRPKRARHLRLFTSTHAHTYTQSYIIHQYSIHTFELPQTTPNAPQTTPTASAKELKLSNWPQLDPLRRTHPFLIYMVKPHPPLTDLFLVSSRRTRTHGDRAAAGGWRAGGHQDMLPSNTNRSRSGSGRG